MTLVWSRCTRDDLWMRIKKNDAIKNDYFFAGFLFRIND